MPAKPATRAELIDALMDARAMMAGVASYLRGPILDPEMIGLYLSGMGQTIREIHALLRRAKK